MPNLPCSTALAQWLERGVGGGRVAHEGTVAHKSGKNWRGAEQRRFLIKSAVPCKCYSCAAFKSVCPHPPQPPFPTAVKDAQRILNSLCGFNINNSKSNLT